MAEPTYSCTITQTDIKEYESHLEALPPMLKLQREETRIPRDEGGMSVEEGELPSLPEVPVPEKVTVHTQDDSPIDDEIPDPRMSKKARVANLKENIDRDLFKLAAGQLEMSCERASEIMTIVQCRALLASDNKYMLNCVGCKREFMCWAEDFILCPRCEDHFVKTSESK
jgi:hypothetical protein